MGSTVHPGVRMRFFGKSVVLFLIAMFLLAELGCGDQYRPVANPISSPGGQPQATHFAWVVNYNPVGNGSTTEIDVSGDSNLAVNSMGAGTSYEAFPFNSLSLYVANAGDDTVMQYLPTLNGNITTISLPAGSHPIAITSQNNSFMFALNQGPSTLCQNNGSISTTRTSTLSGTNTTCIGQNPTAMGQSPADGWIYAINQGDNTVSVVNPSGPTVVGNPVAMPSGQTAVALATNTAGWVFVITQGGSSSPGAVQIIAQGATTDQNGQQQVVIAASVPLGVLPTYAVVDPNRQRLYVANNGDNTVSVYDSSNINPSNNPAMPLLATAPVGMQPVGVAVLLDGTTFYVANQGSNTVSVVSQSSFSTVATVNLPSGANPVWIAAEPGSQKVYVADQGTSETTVIATSNNAITANVPAPQQVSSCSSNCALQTPLMIVTQ
jgi:YVTN family beta-propeller protein